MSTKILLPSSYITDRYLFRSQSNDTRIPLKNKKSENISSSQRKRSKFSSKNSGQYSNIYKFSNNQNKKRSHSSDTNRYYFSLDQTFPNSQQTLTYRRSSHNLEQRSVKFIDESSTTISDTPYLFSKSIKSQKNRSTTSTYMSSEDTSTYQRQKSRKILESVIDPLLSTSNISPIYRSTTRMDTVTSTNGSLSLLRRIPRDKSPTVHFDSSSLTPTVRSYLNEARELLIGKRLDHSTESFEKSVDRLVSSVNKKYGQYQTISSTNSSSLDYISQYYAKEDTRYFDSDDDEQEKFSYTLNINRTHTQIMKSVNKSLIDHNYHIDKNRIKHLEENVRRYLRLFENQSLQRELNYDLIRCFSSSYLHDLRQEEIRQNQIRSFRHSYTYEDIQDIHIPSMLEAYKMKLAIDREKHQRLQSYILTRQLSPQSSSGYSPIMIGSLNENMDTQSGGFDTDRKSFTSASQISTNLRPDVDVFYEIMQESFRSIDASIAGRISKASQLTKSKFRQSHKTTRITDSDIDIKSNSSFWSDEEIDNQYINENRSRKRIPHQRKISRYISTVNRSLLDYPSDLIADFYLSQLNRNMQESVRHIEIISRDQAYQRNLLDYRQTNLGRSLSAEHLYQVRKEHLRYKQPFTKPASFTAEDVADIYKRFVLENYKRKIAIELERRRRARYRYYSEIDLTPKTFQRPLRIRNDFLMTKPPIIVQKKEIIMGRARRSLTNDGSDDVVYHVSTISPPTIYSDNIQSSLETKLKLTTTTMNQPDITTIDPPDFRDRNQQNDIIETLRRPKTKIYTNIPLTKSVHICQANAIETESDSDNLSVANIETFITLNQHEINCLTDQSYNSQLTNSIEQQPKVERSTLIITVNQHMPTIKEDIPIIDLLQPRNFSRPSMSRAHEISGDSGISLNNSYIREQPFIFDSFKINNEPLAEYEKTIIRNDIPDIDPSNEPIILASLLEELTSAINKQHATSIIDENYYWKTCENIEENIYIPIIVYDTEWHDENVQNLSNEYLLNIQNAQYKYPENIEYEYVKINHPYIVEIQEIFINNNDEQIQSLPNDSYLIRHQQQSNICMDKLPNLENPLHSTDILTLNYAYYKKNSSKFSTISQSSSYHDMETFLNEFEESLDHEQHLPLIDQISISYTTSIHEYNQIKKRSLPIEWYKSSNFSHDEQLVEQWIVEKNLDTIQHEGTLHRSKVDFHINTSCDNILLPNSTYNFCMNEKLNHNNNNSSFKDYNDMISHCSPTSDYETDTIEKDNDTATSTVIIPLTILPSSSITNTSLLSQSSPLLTSSIAPIAPIVHFLDVLAYEQKEKTNSAKDFLLTIGFGQNKMSEILNTVSIIDSPLRPIWINRSIENMEILPINIHHEDETTLSLTQQQQIHYANENQLDDDDTAFLIYPRYLQDDHDSDENTQAPLNTFFEPTHLHLPMVNEIYIYQMSFHMDFPVFYPPDTLPHMLITKIQENELHLLDKYQINQPEILSFAQINYLVDNEETKAMAIKLDQPSYIEHYYIQPLFPFPETCYAEMNQSEIITNNNYNNNNNNNNDFLSNFILTKPIKSEDDDLLNQFMGEILRIIKQDLNNQNFISLNHNHHHYQHQHHQQ